MLIIWHFWSLLLWAEYDVISEKALQQREARGRKSLVCEGTAPRLQVALRVGQENMGGSDWPLHSSVFLYSFKLPVVV